MNKVKVYDMFYDLINGVREQIIYSNGYKEFEDVYEELKQQGNLIKEKDDTYTKITSNYPTLLREIKNQKVCKRCGTPINDYRDLCECCYDDMYVI